MTPYPNLRGLVEGQNVKHHGKMIYADLEMTNMDFYSQVQQIANWLASKGLKPKERVWVKQQSFPQTELLLFGVWTLGASVVLVDDPNRDVQEVIKPDLVIDENPIPTSIKDFESYFEPSYKSLLGDEAMVFVTGEKGIRLSHYNLLVNANDVQRKLDLFDDGTFFVDLEPTSTAWVVLQAIFPLYTGAPITKKNPDLTIGTKNADYIVNFKWTEINESNQLYIIPENTAVLSVGDQGLHLTSFDQKENQLTINGHSVMMGYTNDELNEKVFTGQSLIKKLDQ